MQRDPAIHIRRSDLVNILNRFFPGAEISVNDIMREAMKCSIRNRVNLILPAKSRKRAERVADTESEWVDTFNAIYMSVMSENNIKVLSIHKKDPMYLTLKEVTRQAVEFCNVFELDYQIGFKTYVGIGVKLLRDKYSLYRLKASADRIVTLYREILTIQSDTTPDLTTKMFKCWQDAMKKYALVSVSDTLPPDKYVHFIHAKNDAESIGAIYSSWITAQFEKWSHLNSIPELSQLHGDNAKLNYQIFIGKETGYDKAIKEKVSYTLKRDQHKTRG